MILVQDFFNKLATEIRSTYFPNVKYYRDNEQCVKASYAIELTNNGCMSYTKLVSELSKHCTDSPENIQKIVDKYLVD